MDLRANTAVDVLIGPFVDSTDGNTDETGLTISQADVRLSKNGQNMAQKNDATACVHDEIGYYNCELDATDTNTEGSLVLAVHESGALHVRHEYNVMSEAAWDSLYGPKDDGFMDVNIKTIGRSDTQETEANNLESACSNYSATRGLTGTALPAAAADAAGGVPVSDAGGLDLDTILDVAISTRGTADTGDAMNLAADAIKAVSYDETTAFPLKSADTGSTQIARTGADADTLETLSDQIDLQATLAEQAKIPKSDGTVSWNATAAAQIQSEANDALVAQKLDHLVAVADADDVVNDSVMAKIAASDGDWSGFVNSTDSLEAIRDHIGDGTNLTEAGGTGDHLTAINLPNQVMDITGSITGNLIGDVTGNVDGTVTGKTPSEAGDAMNLAADAIKAVSYDETTAFPLKSDDSGSTQVARTGADADTLETLSDQIDLQATDAKLLAYTQLLARSDAAIETDNSTELAEINANGGSGAGDYSSQTDSQEAIRDHVGDGTNLTEAGGTGDHLTAINLPNQTMDIVGSITGNLIGDVTGNVDGTVTGKTPSETGDAMNLAADAIKAVSYDETTAFPLKSDDSGSTQVARTGADGDTLETISDEIAALNDISVADIIAGVTEGSLDLEEMLRLILAACAGEISGGGTATILAKNPLGTKTRVTATVDANGNRTVVVDGGDAP